MKSAIRCIIAATAVFVLAAANPAPAATKLTLMLDWFPNIDHLPLYVAAGKGFFAKEGVEVDIRVPSSTTDALKLAASDNVDIAISYAPQVVMGVSEGLKVKVIGRLVEHPLSVLLFLKGRGIETPKDLNGKTVGYTVPGMMDILLEAFAKKNGIAHYRPVNVGFAIIQPLVAGKVDAVMGPYKNYEVVELAEKGYAAGYFELAQWGIPDYDELVFICGPRAIKDKRDALVGFARAIDRAIRYTRENPGHALEVYFAAVPEAPRQMEGKAFAATLPLFAGNQSHDQARWQVLADFAYSSGLVRKKVDAGMLLWRAVP